VRKIPSALTVLLVFHIKILDFTKKNPFMRSSEADYCEDIDWIVVKPTELLNTQDGELTVLLS